MFHEVTDFASEYVKHIYGREMGVTSGYLYHEPLGIGQNLNVLSSVLPVGAYQPPCYQGYVIQVDEIGRSCHTMFIKYILQCRTIIQTKIYLFTIFYKPLMYLVLALYAI